MGNITILKVMFGISMEKSQRRRNAFRSFIRNDQVPDALPFL